MEIPEELKPATIVASGSFTTRKEDLFTELVKVNRPWPAEPIPTRYNGVILNHGTYDVLVLCDSWYIDELGTLGGLAIKGDMFNTGVVPGGGVGWAAFAGEAMPWTFPGDPDPPERPPIQIQLRIRNAFYIPGTPPHEFEYPEQFMEWMLVSPIRGGGGVHVPPGPCPPAPLYPYPPPRGTPSSGGIISHRRTVGGFRRGM